MNEPNNSFNVKESPEVCANGHPKPLVGAQLIIWGNDLFLDFNKVVAFCSKVRYSFIEAPDIIPDIPADIVNNAVSRYKIPLYAIHVGFPSIETNDNLECTLKYLNKVKTKVLISSGIAHDPSRNEYDQTADILNRTGTRCQLEGVQLYYHTFWWEFLGDEEGHRGIDRLIENTDASLVKFNLDICWSKAGGLDPCKAMNLFGDRCDYFHVKDGHLGLSPDHIKWLPLGEGDIDVKSFIRKVIDCGKCCRVVVEQDEPHISPKTSEVLCGPERPLQ